MFCCDGFCVDFHFSKNKENFYHLFFGLLYFFFGEEFVEALCPVLNWILLLNCMNSLYLLDINPSWIHHSQFFFLIVYVGLSFCCCVLGCPEAFKVDVPLSVFAFVSCALGRFVYGECLCIYMLVRNQCWVFSLIALRIILGDSYSSAPELVGWATLAGQQVLVIPVSACQC